MVCVIRGVILADDNDLTHALRAIYSTYFDSDDIKHALYAVLLHAFYLFSVVCGLRAHTIAPLSVLSHLAAIGIFLFLTRHLYPMFMNEAIAVLVRPAS